MEIFDQIVKGLAAGGPFAAVAAILFISIARVVSRLAEWLKPHVETLVKAHLDFLSKQKEVMDSFDDTLQRMGVSISGIERTAEKMNQLIPDAKTKLDEIHATVVGSRTAARKE